MLYFWHLFFFGLEDVFDFVDEGCGFFFELVVLVLVVLELVCEGLDALGEGVAFLGEHVCGGVDVVEEVVVCFFCLSAGVGFEFVISGEVLFCEVGCVVCGSLGYVLLYLGELLDCVLYLCGLSCDFWGHCFSFGFLF